MTEFSSVAGVLVGAAPQLGTAPFGVNDRRKPAVAQQVVMQAVSADQANRPPADDWAKQSQATALTLAGTQAVKAAV